MFAGQCSNIFRSLARKGSLCSSSCLAVWPCQDSTIIVLVEPNRQHRYINPLGHMQQLPRSMAMPGFDDHCTGGTQPATSVHQSPWTYAADFQELSGQMAALERLLSASLCEASCRIQQHADVQVQMFAPTMGETRETNSSSHYQQGPAQNQFFLPACNPCGVGIQRLPSA